MSLTSSPQQDIEMLLGRRSLAMIPKDQQEILDQESSWVVGGHQRQGATPRVPDHVLDTITATFLLRRKRDSENTTNVTKTIQTGNVDREAESNEVSNVDTRGQDGNTSERKNITDDEKEDEPRPASEVSSPGSPISNWPSSPERSAPGRASTPPIQSQAIQETPMPNPRPQAANVTLPRLQLQLQPQSHIQTIVIDEDDEMEEAPMEVELPQAHDDSESRVNLESHQQTTSTPAMNIISQVMEADTPPCAQPNQHIVPGTVLMERKSAAPEAPDEQKRHRRFKAYALATPVKPVPSSTSLTRLPSTTFRLPEVDSSLSTSSSLLIPATCTQTSTAPPAPAPSLPPFTSIPNLNEAPSTAPITTIEAPPSTYRNISPPAPSNPYTVFTTTYPSYTSYNGTPKIFIKACICLEYLQSERALREFLYDDFIRTFSGGYLAYVAGAGEDQEALPAIEWFNMLQGEPEYRNMVITRANLKSVLAMFPEDVARARKYISRESRGRENKVVEKVRKQIGSTGAMEADSGVQSPDMSPPGPAKLQRQRRTPPSPQLGSDAPASGGPAPTSSIRSKGPRASQYFERLASASKSGMKRKRSSEEQDRLREHFRKKRVASALGSGSRHGPS